jgi:hypothetical protein
MLAIQSGYYSFEALASFRVPIDNLLRVGGRFDLVIGVNEERLNAADLEKTLELLTPYIGQNATFTLVGARDGLFHPKSYYIELGDRRRLAAVGSSNFTARGIGHHIEASMLLDHGDDPRTLDAVRDAILAWRDKASENAQDARSVTPQLIQELEAERIIDPVPVRASRRRDRRSTSGKSSYPSLEHIAGTPRLHAARRPARSAPGIRLGRAASPLPAEAVGIVKRLSAKTDVKGFSGGQGTPYVALPPNKSDLAPCLPMRPFGIHNEPRLDVLIEARFYEAPHDVVDSGADTANITYVGEGTTRRSNVDLRLNIQHGAMAGLRYIAAQRGLPLPSGGDLVGIEFLEQGRIVRLTFVSTEPLRSVLYGLLHPGRSWGWLPARVLPDW